MWGGGERTAGAGHWAREKDTEMRLRRESTSTSPRLTGGQRMMVLLDVQDAEADLMIHEATVEEDS